MSKDNRTQQLLDIMFPPVKSEPEPRLEWEDFDDGSWSANFNYINRQGKASAWHIDLHQAVFFDFRNRYYMIIRGERNGPVCFRLEDCMMGTEKTLVCEVEGAFDVVQADPDCFPTEDTQDWMLKQHGI